MKKPFTITIFFVACFASLVQGQSVPPMFNYQGQLLNPDGTPLATADYALSFKVYDAVQGGNLIWGPQIFDGRSGTGLGPKIPVVQGYFNVILGPSDTNGVQLSDAFSVATRYLEITISNQPPIGPRQQILSAPYALSTKYAQFASSATNANFATSAALATTAGFATNAALATIAISATNAQNLGGILATNYFLGLVPVGAILPYFLNTNTLPANWRYCDGSYVGDTDSPLYGTYLPDLRQYFLRGTDSSFPIGSTGGTDTVLDHSHYFYGFDSSVYFPVASGNGYAGGQHYIISAADGLQNDTTKIDLEAPVSGTYGYSSHGHEGGSSSIAGYTYSAGGHDNRPRFFSVNFIIRIR